MKIEQLLLTEDKIAEILMRHIPTGDFDDAVATATILCLAQIEKIKRESGVIMAGDQSLPKSPSDFTANYQDGWYQGLQAALTAGFRRVEEIE